MSRREQGFRTGGQPDDWKAPSKEEILAKKIATRSAAESANTSTPEQRLFAAEMDRLLPSLDLHGATTADVRFEVDQFLATNPESGIRIVAGNGKGQIMGEVNRYLGQLKRQKNSPIVDYLAERGGVSYVVLVR